MHQKKGYDLSNPQQAQQFRQVAISQGANPTETDQYISDQKKTIENLNKSYTLENAHIYLFSSTDSLTKDDDISARKLCAYAIVDDYGNKYETPQSINYQLNLKEYTEGGWSQVLLWLFIGIVLLYILLNIAREALNYVFFGKDFSWQWLCDVINKLHRGYKFLCKEY